MLQTDAIAYTEKCINGEPAACSSACPFQLDVRSFMEKTAKARWNSAYKALRNAFLFPAVVGALCPAPCESKCLRVQTGDEPVAVRMIEEACIRSAGNKKPENYAIPPKTQRAAVIGAGIAGLSAALCLAQKKYPVTVYDKNSGWGGSLRPHPRFGEFDADIAAQFSATDTEFVFSAQILSLEELAAYDVVYIATGAGGDDFGLLESWDPILLTTAEPKVFMGGEIAAADLASSIIQGKTFSKTAEVFFQTGKASGTFEGAGEGVCLIDCSGEPSVPRVSPAGPDGYTGAEAESESSRCFQCDCSRCVVSCEMLGTFRKKPKKIALEVYADTKATPPYSTHTLTRQTYSCNMCGHCKAVCPEDINIGALLQSSRVARAGEADYPEAFHDFWLREMDFMSRDASFFAPAGGSPGYVFFPGCQLGAHNPGYVFKPLAFLRENYNAGVYLNCCGAPAYWAGDTERQAANFERIRAVWRGSGSPAFVFACASCESMFEMFLPEIKRVSLYELLAQQHGAVPEHVFDSASVFDPCSARGLPATAKAVRTLASMSGATLFKLPEENRCCGYGGHIYPANPGLFDTVTAARAGMGEHPYIVYCANCREIFLSRGKENAHILDVVFGLDRRTAVPKIDEKHNNAIRVKMKLSKELKNEDFSADPQSWDALELIIDDSVAESADRKLIALSDIKEAIWRAEGSGEKFVDETDGTCHCSMEKPVLTYWVQYKKTTGGAYEVYGAYYHRMRISRED